MRDTSLEADPNGSNRALGEELDLTFSLDRGDGIKLLLTFAQFDSGRAYADYPDRGSDAIKVEFSYEF